jgi:hypothetical protein
MENENKSNQNSDSKSNKDNGNSKESVLTLLQPHDMSKTVESALHVLQGKHEKLPDLMQDIGHIIVKATKRFTTTQLIVAAGALTVGAVLLSRYNSDNEFEYSGD